MSGPEVRIAGWLLKVCVNGSRRPGDHPALPISPRQVAAEVAAAARAGAAHVHAKNDASADTFDSSAVAAVLTRTRMAVPGFPIGVTTGAWALPDPIERVAAILSWTVLPDFASVNWHEDGAEAVAGTLLDRGIGVEAGLWHRDAVEAWLHSRYRDFCLRILIELPDRLDEQQTQSEAERLLRQVHESVRGTAAETIPVLLHGEGSSCWPALRLAVRLGLDIRIGLEDTLQMPDGTPAQGNTALVEAAAALAATRLDP